MMSVNLSEEIDYAFLAAKKRFNEMGFELIGTKEINGTKIFSVKENDN